jgi:hypothetical protein
MNRRHFFRSVAALDGAASLSPTIFIPKFEPVPWKRSRQFKPQLNPEWVNARYEVALLYSMDTNPQNWLVTMGIKIDPVTHKPILIPAYL